MSSADGEFLANAAHASRKDVRDAVVARTRDHLGDDRDGNTVSFRFRDGSQRNGVAIDEAISLVRKAIDEKAQVTTADDLG